VILWEWGTTRREKPSRNDLMLSQTKTKLSPLFVKEGVPKMNFWMTADSAEVESGMDDIVAEIRQHRDNALSEILGTSHQRSSLLKHKRQLKFWPPLKKYAISLDDTRVHQIILKDLNRLNRKIHGTTTL
jgi:hypothetical protein